MIEGASEILLGVGGVSGLGGLAGAMIGNRIDLKWIKEKISEHHGRLTAHEKFIQAHELEIALIKKGQEQ